MEQLEQRIAGLEHRVTRYRNALLFLVVCVCAFVVLGAATDDGIIRGRELVLADEKGNKRLVARVDGAGNGEFSLYRNDGKVQIVAGVAVSGPGILEIMGEKGNIQIFDGALSVNTGSTLSKVVTVSSDGRGNGSLMVMSKDGWPGFVASADSSGGRLEINGRWSMVPVVEAGVAIDTTGYLAVRSSEGEGLVYAGASEGGNGLFKVKSKTGKDLIYAGSNSAGGVLAVMSNEGKDLMHAGASESGFWLEGYNKTGEGVVQLYADDYGNGVVGAFNRKGKGKMLKPGP